MMNEFQTFLNALQFYTRIPLGKSVKYTAKRQQDSIRYFPVIGLIVGAVMAGVILGLDSYLGDFSAVTLGLLVSVLITGALHEDGLADCCDGFGGGWTKKKVLSIMKDSSIGAYGAIGLIFLLILKFSLLIKLLSLLNDWSIVLVLITCQVISRSSAASIMLFLDYARTDDSSKSREVAKRLSTLNAILIFAFGIVSIAGILYFSAEYWVAILIPILALFVFLMKVYFKRRIGGYTGDCLGMLQQLSELVIYGTFVVLWN